MRKDLKMLEETMNEFDKKLITRRAGFPDKVPESVHIWQLGMNINPGDEHLFGYTVGKKK